jgi:hypothetical protein
MLRTYFSSHINGELVSRQREWRWFHCCKCCISIREHAKLHLMLHTSVAISMESLSQDKKNDVGFIVVSQVLGLVSTCFARVALTRDVKECFGGVRVTCRSPAISNGAGISQTTTRTLRTAWCGKWEVASSSERGIAASTTESAAPRSFSFVR